MNKFIFSGEADPTANYVACWQTPVQTHLTGFDTLAEARQYVANQKTNRVAANRLTLAIVQTQNDELIYYRQWSKPRPLARLLSFFW